MARRRCRGQASPVIGLCVIMATLVPVCGMQVVATQESKTYLETYGRLRSFEHLKDNRDVLAELFRDGDSRIADLIRALHSSDSQVSLRAQIVIRYLGNEQGMKALEEWYRARTKIDISGPIPIPVSERDYHNIEVFFLNRPSSSWSNAEPYIYALKLDGSPRAEGILKKLTDMAGMLDEANAASRALRLMSSADSKALLVGESDLAKLVMEHAFFVQPYDLQHTSAKLLALNETKKKALIEVYVNRGVLAEEWYHVVIEKSGKGWKFFSVTEIALS